jgi:hypothetical protein
MKKPTVNSSLNSTTLSSNRRRVQVVHLVDSNNKPIGKNMICFKALVADVGDDAGVLHKVSSCGRVKTSGVSLTDDALFELYTTLKMHFEYNASCISSTVKQNYFDKTNL